MRVRNPHRKPGPNKPARHETRIKCASRNIVSINNITPSERENTLMTQKKLNMISPDHINEKVLYTHFLLYIIHKTFNIADQLSFSSETVFVSWLGLQALHSQV